MLRERDVKTPETPSPLEPDTPHASRKADLTNLIPSAAILPLPLMELLSRVEMGPVISGTLGSLAGIVIYRLYKDVTATVGDYGKEDNEGKLKFACVGGAVGAAIGSILFKF